MRRTFALLTTLIGASSFAQAPIPIEHFTRFDSASGLQISPDGKFIALLSGEEGRSRLEFIELANSKVASGVQSAGSSKIGDYRWVGPKRLIYTMLSSSPSRAAPLEDTAIYGIDRDGNDHRQLLRGYSVSELLPNRRGSDSQYFLFAAWPLRNVGGLYYENRDAKASVTRVNVYGYSNEMRWRQDKAPLGNAQMLLDHDDRLRFVLGSNADWWPAAGWKPDPDGEWQTFDLEDFRRDDIRAVRFGPDDRSVFLIGARHDEPFTALYSLDLRTRQLARVYAFDNSDVLEVITDFADSKIVGVRGYADSTLEHWLLPDDPAARTYEALHRAFPGQRIRLTSISDDGSAAIVLVDSDVNPGDYYLFDTVNAKAQFLRAARAWIDPKQMRPKEPIALTSRDGLQLHGYVTRPAGGGPQPMVVLPHDGPWGTRDHWQFDWEVQLLANRGYAVLQVNYRGSPGYGVKFERAGNGQWGARIQNDIADATRWAIAQGIARADRICIYGKGYGGYAALMGLVRDRDLYRCAIGYGGLYDLKAETRHTEFSQLERLRMESVLGTNSAQLRVRSPVENAENMMAPVLLIHGKHDWNVDYHQAERMKNALEWQRRPVELLPLPREGPTAYDEDTRREVYERILQFLDTNLRTQPAAAPPTAAAETP